MDGSVLTWGGCGGFYRQSCGGRKYKPMFFEDIYSIYIQYIYITIIYTYNRYYRPTYLQNHFLCIFSENDEYSHD